MTARLAPGSRAARGLALVRGIIADQSAQRLTLVAAGGAFWLVIAVFPAVLAVISVFGLVLTPDEIAQRLTDLFGSDRSGAGSVLIKQIEAFAQSTTGSLTLQLVLSVLVAVWSVSAATYNLSRALRAIYDLDPRRYLIARIAGYAAAFAMILALGVLVIAFTTVSALASDLSGGWVLLAWLIGVPAATVLLAVVLMGIHAFSVGAALPLARLAPGCSLAACALMAINFGLRYYLELFPPQTAVYGALAGFVVFMLLAWIAVYIVLLAGVLNRRLDPLRAEPAGVRP